MVRAPTRTCPHLSNLFDTAPPILVAAFFKSKPFERFTWVEGYMPRLDGIPSNEPARAMLATETKMRLGPLETEAARIVTMAGNRGQFALEGLATTKLTADRLQILIGQRDELARSLWAYVHESSLFDATENGMHMRLYRRYDRHYQTFMAEPSPGTDRDVEESLVKDLLAELKGSLNRGDGYRIDRFDLPEEADEPAAVMYLLSHPSPPTSARDMDDDGNSARIYFRPPGEAMIVYTPSTGRVHARAGTRSLRHKIADAFIEKVLSQEPSRQPVDFQAYDISKFRSEFDLARPAMADVEIVAAKVIQVQVSVEDLASRLSVSTSIESDLATLVENQPGLARIFERAIATRFLEIAVRYRRKDKDETRTLSFTVTDRNTCSLLSVDDPFERVLGHRLLRHWGILREGRAPSETDAMSVLPALLEIWDIGAETLSGAWLFERQIDPQLLIEIGFLVPSGADDGDVIDDEDGIGQATAEVVTRSDGIGVKTIRGQEAPGGPADRYCRYRVRKGWVAQYVREFAAKSFDNSAVPDDDANLVALGTLQIEGRDVPVYLVRGLDDERARESIDTKLRSRPGGKVGLVLQAGSALGSSISGNVLTRLIDHLEGTLPAIGLNLASLRSVYERNCVLANGGAIVEFVPLGDTAGTLFVPKKGSIYISGEHKVRVIQRLVDAHNSGSSPTASDDLRKGILDQSLANIFNQPLWDKLKADFIRSPKKPFWEIAT